jgi:excisionase family DNA binding protein
MDVLKEKRFSIREVAKILGISREYAYTLIREGELEALRIRRKFVVEESALIAFLNESRYQPPDKENHRYKRVKRRSIKNFKHLKI